MNDTIAKFGYPDSLITEYEHWLVLLRPAQPTLGSLILAARSDKTAFCELEPAAFAELAIVTKAIETALGTLVAYEKINYLMLMMVDPHVHFHIIPRYAGVREFAGHSFRDDGWPKLPELGQAVTLDPANHEKLRQALMSAWVR